MDRINIYDNKIVLYDLKMEENSQFNFDDDNYGYEIDDDDDAFLNNYNDDGDDSDFYY
jgi:hypothetical protein